MSTRERIREWLTRRSVWAAACCLPVVVLFVVAVWSQRHGQQRAAVPQRENLNLQLGQLAREVAREADDLAERAHDLAQSELIARLAQDDAVSSAERSELVGLTRRTVDALLVVSASKTVRFSAKFAGDDLSEQPPVPEAMQFLASAAASS